MDREGWARRDHMNTTEKITLYRSPDTMIIIPMLVHCLINKLINSFKLFFYFTEKASFIFSCHSVKFRALNDIYRLEWLNRPHYTQARLN